MTSECLIIDQRQQPSKLKFSGVVYVPIDTEDSNFAEIHDRYQSNTDGYPGCTSGTPLDSQQVYTLRAGTG